MDHVGRTRTVYGRLKDFTQCFIYTFNLKIKINVIWFSISRGNVVPTYQGVV